MAVTFPVVLEVKKKKKKKKKKEGRKRKGKQDLKSCLKHDREEIRNVSKNFPFFK